MALWTYHYVWKFGELRYSCSRQRRDDTKTIKQYKGIHQGQRCFIIGNGPSLTAKDLNKLINEITFSANYISRIFDQTTWRPTYHFSIDRHILKNSFDEVSNVAVDRVFLGHSSYKQFCDNNNVTRFLTKRTKKPMFSSDVSNYACDLSTVTSASIQFAVYMGFSKIYLIGCDHSYQQELDTSNKIVLDRSVKNHFYENKEKSNVVEIANLSRVTAGYEVSRNYCDANGVKIYNATRGGKLEVFERVDFDSLFEE